jgi:hypothetical protein
MANGKPALHHRTVRGALLLKLHLFTDCPFVGWIRLTAAFPLDKAVRLFLAVKLPEKVSSEAWTDVLIMLVWHIWKASNAVIFQAHQLTTAEIFSRCADVTILQNQLTFQTDEKKSSPHII